MLYTCCVCDLQYVDYVMCILDPLIAFVLLFLNDLSSGLSPYHVLLLYPLSKTPLSPLPSPIFSHPSRLCTSLLHRSIFWFISLLCSPLLSPLPSPLSPLPSPLSYLFSSLSPSTLYLSRVPVGPGATGQGLPSACGLVAPCPNPYPGAATGYGERLSQRGADVSQQVGESV
jgi:hypothetical protein